ncbi:hypothetical protein PINS_up022215 [Pythium insidiosum]|nr:hypothetical protein PINS_up022215 [Pythium insidiosum]
MNSFLNSWLLDDSVDLADVTAACDNAFQVVTDLVAVAANATATNDTAMKHQCAVFIDKIQHMIDEKIDFAMAHILQYADEYTDSNSRSEVKMVSASNWVKLGLWINLLAKGSRNKRIDFTELGISVDLPKAAIMQSLALRVTFLPFDALSEHNPQNFDFALGGVLTLDLLAIPAPPRRARGWVMREVADAADRIKKLHYPLEGMVASAALPVKVSVQLPSHVIYAATPRVGWWDPHTQTWEEDGITEINLNRDTHVLSFSTMHVTHLAVLQQRDLNYHKYLWSLKMSTKVTNKAYLQLKTEHFEEIRFEITDSGCRLVAPDLPQLRSVLGSVLPPGELLVRLADSGIALCPGVDDDMRFGYTPKLKSLEDRVIQEVVSVVSAFKICIGNLALESPNGGMRWVGAMENPKQIVFA